MPLLHIGAIHAGGMNFHQHFAGARPGNRALREHERFRTAGRRYVDDALHEEQLTLLAGEPNIFSILPNTVPKNGTRGLGFRMSVMNSAAQVIRLLARGPELSFGDVVHGLGLPKSTVSRLLAQMSRLGLIERDVSTRRFRAGLLLLEAAQMYRRGNVLGELGQASLANLSAETGYTGYLATLDGTDTVVLQRFNGTHPLQIVSPPGTRRPAHMTAMGRVLLSRLSDAEFHKRFGKRLEARLPGALANGPETVGELLQRIRRAQREHCVVVTNDGLPGIAAIACSLSDPSNGDTVGLCLTFLNGLISKAQVQKLRDLFVSRIEILGRRVGDPLWCGQRKAA